MAGRNSAPNKLKLLTEAKEYYTQIINTINAIESGMTEADACNKYGMSVTDFRQNTFYRRKFTKNVPKPFSPLEFYKEPSWRLYEDILGQKLTIKDLDTLPPDLDVTLATVMSEALPAKQYQAVRYIYFENMSYTKVAEKLGVTSTNIRGLVNTALKKLRTPPQITRVTYGDNFVRVMNERRKDYSNSILEMSKARESLASNNSDESYLGHTINILELPTRCYNCLRRAGMVTVGDVVDAIDKGYLWKVKNLGVKSMGEVIDAVNRYVLKCQGKEPLPNMFDFPSNL